jgi:hypothetical protein
MFIIALAAHWIELNTPTVLTVNNLVCHSVNASST